MIYLLTSCNPTKYVPEGETLLNANYINVNKEEIKKNDLLPYIKQNPNKQIFGTKFYLGLYNLSNINKEKWPHGWLRNIGEAPVIFDEYSAEKTTEQIKSYVASKGYFDGTVTDSVITSRKKSDVHYNVDLSHPYTIRNISYEIADSNIRKLFYFDSINCMIVRGRPYDVDVLQNERTRFERYIRDRGFYAFSIDYISFKIDSTAGNRQVDIKYEIRDFTGNDSYNSAFSVYSIKNIYIYPDYVPKEALEKGEAYFQGMDTTFYRGYYFVSALKNQEVKYDLILRSLYLIPGNPYNVTGTELTQSHLLSLKIYRLIDINFADAKENATLQSLQLMLDCNIQLTLLSQQSYKVELEGTNSGGNLGGALNLIYQHKNLFHGAELLSMKLKGAYSVYKLQDSSGTSKLKSVQEFGFETSLKLPKFILPFFNTEAFIAKYNPATNLQISYNYQNMPFYTRTIANAGFGYNWKAGNYQEHIVNPIQFNMIKLPFIDPSYQKSIEQSSYQANSYKDVLILGGNYSFIFNNQKIKNSKNYWFMRINTEASGNILSAIYKITNQPKKDTTFSTLAPPFAQYSLFGQPFAQYVKADIDARYNYRFNDVSSVVYRGFFGIGIPYGNSKAVPFERQYFSGGANGIRAWQVRSLGPGSYDAIPPGDTTTPFLNQTADIKLEANAEYRFKLFWILEGAVFVDVGNIWSYNDDVERPGSQFKLNRFYKDIAVGTGTGFRFDFKFIIARVDVGMKLRDPLLTSGEISGPELGQEPGSKWIFLNGPYRRDDFTVVFGIGYPF
jgi:hypothetical protein